MKNKFILILIIVFLTGCYDKVELENRNFIFSIGIDEKDDKFLITLAIPDDSEKIIKENEDTTISGALYKITFMSPNVLDYRHTKIIVVGQSILENKEKLRSLIDILERNKQLSRKVLIVTTDNANEFLKSQSKENNLVSKNILDFYINNGNLFGLNKDLDQILQNIENKKIITLPYIQLSKADDGSTKDTKDTSKENSNSSTNKGLNENISENNNIPKSEILINSATIIYDYKNIGIINNDPLKGYIFANGNGEGEFLFDSNNIAPFKVSKSSSNMKVTNKNNNLVFKVSLDIEGDIKEFNDTGYVSSQIDVLNKEYEQDLIKYLVQAKEYFLNKNIDGFDVKEQLYKYHYDLYEKHAKNNPDFFNNVEYEFEANVKINSIGSVK